MDYDLELGRLRFLARSLDYDSQSLPMTFAYDDDSNSQPASQPAR